MGACRDGVLANDYRIDGAEGGSSPKYSQYRISPTMMTITKSVSQFDERLERVIPPGEGDRW